MQSTLRRGGISEANLPGVVVGFVTRSDAKLRNSGSIKENRYDAAPLTRDIPGKNLRESLFRDNVSDLTEEDLDNDREALQNEALRRTRTLVASARSTMGLGQASEYLPQMNRLSFKAYILP